MQWWACVLLACEHISLSLSRQCYLWLHEPAAVEVLPAANWNWVLVCACVWVCVRLKVSVHVSCSVNALMIDKKKKKSDGVKHTASTAATFGEGCAFEREEHRKRDKSGQMGGEKIDTFTAKNGEREGEQHVTCTWSLHVHLPRICCGWMSHLHLIHRINNDRCERALLSVLPFWAAAAADGACVLSSSFIKQVTGHPVTWMI